MLESQVYGHQSTAAKRMIHTATVTMESSMHNMAPPTQQRDMLVPTLTTVDYALLLYTPRQELHTGKISGSISLVS